MKKFNESIEPKDKPRIVAKVKVKKAEGDVISSKRTTTTTAKLKTSTTPTIKSNIKSSIMQSEVKPIKPSTKQIVWRSSL